MVVDDEDDMSLCLVFMLGGTWLYPRPIRGILARFLLVGVCQSSGMLSWD